MNKNKKNRIILILLAVPIILAIQGMARAAGTAPTIAPAGADQYVLVSTTKHKLTASGGVGDEPTTSAPCPPWEPTGTVSSYEWSDGTTTSAKDVDISSPGAKGSFTVKGTGQNWKDKAPGTATAGPTVTPSSASIKITAVDVFFDGSNYLVDDGAPLEINIICNPTQHKSKITNAMLSISPTKGTPTALSPGGLSTVVKKNTDFEWLIPNAYWTDVGCDINSEYDLKYTFDLNGESNEITSKVTVIGLTAGGSGKHIGGEAFYTSLGITGSPLTITEYDVITKKVVASTGSPGGLLRYVTTGSNYFNHIDSQFKAMIQKEESEHMKQMEGVYGAAEDPSAGFFDVTSFYNKNLATLRGYSSVWSGSAAPTSGDLKLLESQATSNLQDKILKAYEAYDKAQWTGISKAFDKKRIAMEKAAKSGCQYLLTFSCRY